MYGGFFRQMYTVTANKVGVLTVSHFGLKSDIKKQGLILIFVLSTLDVDVCSVFCVEF